MKRWLVMVVMLMMFSMGAVYNAFPSAKKSLDSTYDQLKMLVDVMTIIRDNYVEERETKELIVGALKGMVKTLDPYSQFMEPDSYKEMKTETEGHFGGLGIRISMRDEWLTVITPLPGTPAYRQGILPNDKIIEIEKKSTRDITLREAVKKLRGTPGTKVNITVAREGAKAPIPITITREIIKIQTIYKRMLSDDIGYIRLTEFSANSERDLVKALKHLSQKGMTSLVFDLRNNPGGLLNTAVGVCRQFVGNNQMIVYTQGRHKKSRREYRAGSGDAPFGKLPLVVLVNHGSASGSEIVAGCMQDLKRGLIIGTTTFGKGSVQSVLPLAQGNALRLTTAKYYTASGRVIHRNKKTGKGGVTPDIIVNVPIEVEAKLYRQSEEIYEKGKKPSTAAKKEERVEDVALTRAIEMLKAQRVFDQMQKEKK